MTPVQATTALLLALGLAACATPASRISSQQSAFDSYPTEVQQKIRAGQIGIGFSPEQVRMALGEPSDRYSRQTEKGESEVWAYRDFKPGLSFGMGTFSGGSTSVGGGIGIGTGGGNAEDKLRVTFEAGRVTAIEQAAK